MAHPNLLSDHPQKLFFHYLLPSIGATLVSSIYILADTVMIGRGIGADALAALNLVLPVFAVFFSTGMLFGVGGGVMMSVAMGSGDKEKARRYFSTALLFCLCALAALFLIFTLFFENIAYALGCDDSSIVLVRQYGYPIVWCCPVFTLSSFLQAFVRNDRAPRRAMLGVLCGGVTNIVLDYLFIYPLGLGMAGAAWATVAGNGVTVLILLSHFLSKQNSMRFSLHSVTPALLRDVAGCGVSSFLTDIANGVVIFLFNLQLLSYIGSLGVVVYSIISNSALIAMSVFNGVSQAAQPIMAANFGAKSRERVLAVRRLGLITVVCAGAALCLVGMAWPELLINAFVEPTNDIYTLGVVAIRIYFTAFLLMNLNIFFSNYFQAIVRPRSAFAVCVLRGLVLCAAFVFLLPAVMGPVGIWLSVPLTEAVTLGVALILLKKARPA